MPRSDLYNAFGVNFGLIRSPGCAAARRPWAVEYNAFGVGPGRHANGIKTPDLGDNLRVHNSIAVSHRNPADVAPLAYVKRIFSNASTERSIWPPASLPGRSRRLTG